MALLAATNIRYSIGTRVLLDGVSLSLEIGQKVGLVGRNGQGKTTLFKILAGQIKPDSGQVILAKTCRMGYLTQDPVLNLDNTLLDEAAAGMQELTQLHRDLDDLYHKMALPENAEPDKIERLLKRQADLQHRLDSLGGYAVEHKVEHILHGLGFTDDQFSIKVRGLSGGQKGRLALAKLLLENPDLLLLDEPTNHLDIAGREWLEEFLANDFPGAVLVISHDRYLLDRVVSSIEEVEQGRLIEYPGNYSAFTEIRKQRLLTQHRAYENQQSQWAKEEEFIRRFRAGQRAKEAQGRLAKLERQKEQYAIERPMELAAMRFTLPPAPRSGDQVCTVRDAAKSYTSIHDDTASTRTLFSDLTFTISRADRWGIIGPNGAGKTTLVKCLLGQIDLDSGLARQGASLAIGYYAQLPPDTDSDLPVYQYLQNAIKKENPAQLLSEQQARDLAGLFLFSGEDQSKPMGALSGGERSRARLAALLASAKNLLILDEPTNHLDIPSAERLEQALKKPSDSDSLGYEGTLILISHDRAIIDATCDHLLIFDGCGNVSVFVGNYSEYHRQQLARQSAPAKPETRSFPSKNQSSRTDPKPSAPISAPSSPAQPPVRPSKPATGLSWMPEERLEKEIARLEKALKEADQALSDPKVYMDPEKTRRALAERDQFAKDLERHESEWLYRMDS